MAAANLAEQVFNRHRDVFENDRSRRTAPDPHLVLFRAGPDSRHAAFHKEGAELLPVDLGENRVEMRPAAVGNPHLLAIEDVVLAVRRQLSAGAGRQRVASGVSFAQAVSRDSLPANHARQVSLLLLMRAKENQRQRPDAGMSTIRCRERSIAAKLFADDHLRRQVQFQAVVLLGNENAKKSQVRRLPEQAEHDFRVFLLALPGGGQDFVGHESLGGRHDLTLLFAEVFGGENAGRGDVVDEETASRGRGDGCGWQGGKRCHDQLLSRSGAGWFRRHGRTA